MQKNLKKVWNLPHELPNHMGLQICNFTHHADAWPWSFTYLSTCMGHIGKDCSNHMAEKAAPGQNQTCVEAGRVLPRYYV
jgi:hypothetical protein